MTASGGSSGHDADFQLPELQIRDSRLSDVVATRYPPGAHRMGEEGRADACIVVNSDGGAAPWTQLQGSGSPRLDAGPGLRHPLSAIPSRPARRSRHCRRGAAADRVPAALMRCSMAGVCYAPDVPAQRVAAGACSRFGQPLRWLWPGNGAPCRAPREELAGAAARNAGMRPARTDEG
jgi:hypothetical protein